jgi:hypothetical protein
MGLAALAGLFSVIFNLKNESPLRGAPVGIKPQGKPWTRNSVSDPAASGEVFDTNKILYAKS